jgi:hypothetical protein
VKRKELFQIIKYHWLELFIGIIGLFMLTGSLTKEKINQNTKFIELRSKLTDYKFEDGSRGQKHYYFYCADFCNKFQIKADYIAYFNKDNFSDKIGTELTFKISERKFNTKYDCNKIYVYEISTERENLLNLNEVLEFENKRYDIITPCLLIFGAIIAFAIRYKNTKNTSANKVL